MVSEYYPLFKCTLPGWPPPTYARTPCAPRAPHACRLPNLVSAFAAFMHIIIAMHRERYVRTHAHYSKPLRQFESDAWSLLTLLPSTCRRCRLCCMTAEILPNDGVGKILWNMHGITTKGRSGRKLKLYWHATFVVLIRNALHVVSFVSRSVALILTRSFNGTQPVSRISANESLFCWNLLDWFWMLNLNSSAVTTKIKMLSTQLKKGKHRHEKHWIQHPTEGKGAKRITG